MQDDNNYMEFKGLQNNIKNRADKENLLSQRFSCEILFNLLSSGEKCIHHYHKDRKYRYYDPFTTAKSKSQEELELEFRNQVRCFQACFIDDVENGGFRYPDNLNKQVIIEDIKGWMKYADMGGRDILYQTYQKLILLLEQEKEIIVDIAQTIVYDNNNSDFINKGIFEGIHKKEFPNFIKLSIFGSNLSFEMESNIKQNYDKGDYTAKAILYQDNPYEKNKKDNNSIKLSAQKVKSNDSNKCC